VIRLRASRYGGQVPRYFRESGVLGPARRVAEITEHQIMVEATGTTIVPATTGSEN